MSFEQSFQKVFCGHTSRKTAAEQIESLETRIRNLTFWIPAVSDEVKEGIKNSIARYERTIKGLRNERI